MAKVGAFKENDSVGGAFKASLFKDLFKHRKNLLEGYPAPKKGLAFPDVKVKFGATPYVFKTTDVVDKVTCKDKTKEFCARYKKGQGKWDVSLKQNICCGGNVLIKYEERSEDKPNYVVGYDNTYGDLSANIKYSPASGLLKASSLYNLNSVVAGVKVGGDMKLNPIEQALKSFNVGVCYGASCGKLAAAYNEKGFVTLSGHVDINSNVAAAVEVVQPTRKDTLPSSPITLAVSAKVDNDHTVRARVNKDGHLNICLSKSMSDNMSVMFSTVYNVYDVAGFTRVPAFGFKVALS